MEAIRRLDAEGRHGTASVLDVGKDDVGDDSAGRTQLPDDDDGGLSFDTEVSHSIVSNVVLSLTSAATDPVIVPVSIAASAAVATVEVNSANVVTLAPRRDPEDTTTEVTIDKSPSPEKEAVDEEKVVPARVSVEVDPTEVKDRRRHDHDNQGALGVADYGESKAAPPPASLSSPPTVASASGILPSPTVVEDSRHDSSTENPSTPSTEDLIRTVASTEVVTVPATSASISSPSVGATHLSARDRLLRHVQIAASSSASGSDSSSSSSDTDNDDGRETVLRGEHTDTAHIEDELIREGRPSGDVNDDDVSEVHPSGGGGGGGVDTVVETEAGKSEADANAVESTIRRPRTTRPCRRHREGGDDDDGEHDETGGSSKSDERVAGSFATSTSPTNSVVAVVTKAGATGGGDPISPLGDPTTTAIEEILCAVTTKDSAVIDDVGATSADTLSIHRFVEPCQQGAIVRLAVEANISCGGVEESKLEGRGEKHNNSVRMAPSDDGSAVTEGYGGSPGVGRQESGAEAVSVPSLIAATRASSATDISPGREHDHNPATEAAGSDSVTQGGRNDSVDRHLDSSTTEPIRVNIGESPEKTQGIPQGSESSLSVVAPRLAHSKPEAEENRRGSNASKVAAKPLAVGPSKASESSQSQHVGEGGDGAVLEELKEEPRGVDNDDSVVLEELKEETREIDDAGKGKPQGSGDVGGEQTLTEKVAEDTAELAWIEGYDPGHDCYYYHHVPTGESRWYKPDEPYEPYVHSDEEEEDSKPSTLDEGGQSKDAQVVVHEDRRDEGKHQKEDGKKSPSSRKSGREGGSGNRRKKREKEEVESGATRATGSSSRRERSSTKKRRSPRSTGSQRQGSSRKRADGDDYFSCSTSPSSSGSRCSVEESRGDGGRGTRRRSQGRQPSVSSRGSAAVDGASGRSRRRAKTALERLNDLTDEDGGVSGGILSGGSGGDTEYVRKGSSKRSRRHHSREAHDEHLYYSKNDRHSGGGDSSRRSSRNTNRDYSPSRKEHHHRNEHDDDVRYAERHPVSHARRRHGSSLLSREDISPNDDDHVKHRRDSSDRRRSTGGRRSSHRSESRRSSTGTAGGGHSRRATREWER